MFDYLPVIAMSARAQEHFQSSEKYDENSLVVTSGPATLNGPSKPIGEFDHWGTPVQQPTYGLRTMTNQDYQMSPSSYYPLGSTYHGLGAMSSGHDSPWGFGYNPSALPSHQPLNSPPNSYAPQSLPADVFAPTGNASYGGMHGYNVFDYTGHNWGPSIVAHDPRVKPHQPLDIYRTPGYHLGDSPYSTFDLDRGIGGISLGGGGVQGTGQLGPKIIDVGSFGQVVPQTAPPPAPKPLTWADKVKQAPKETILTKQKAKIPIGGVGGRAKDSGAGAVWSGSGATSVSRTSSSSTPVGRMTSGWGGGAPVVSARKPPSLSPSDQPGDSLPQLNGTLEKQQELATEPESGDSDFLEKLKKVTNPGELTLPTRGARFFVIKSYSEDDIHRSIKYGFWCSTDHGNKRLDQAWKEREGKGPIFLFYSVNASGHFCGIAQMMSNLDYSKNSGVWSQDKWKGLFKVRWLYVKDVPNTALRHIRLENNENKPVTNSRDTQEVPADKGRQVLRIIHAYKHTTSLFDDFGHYEKRQAEEDTRKVPPPPPPFAQRR